jgi:hypothetical protein
MKEHTRTDANGGALWSRRQLAEYLGVTVRAVQRMPIPRLTLPGRGKKPIVRYDPQQVHAWLDARRSRPVVDARKAG